MSKHETLRQHAMSNAGNPQEPSWRWYRAILNLVQIIIIPLYRIQVSGAENLPKDEQGKPLNVLLTPNHVSYADSVILFTLTKRYQLRMRFLAKRELYRIKPLAWLMDNVGAMPITRGSADLDALKMASRAIKAGDTLAIFPEGTRIKASETSTTSKTSTTPKTSRDVESATSQDRATKLGEAFGGAAWLAITNKVPVVPVGIAGTEKIMPPGAKMFRIPKVYVHFGPALDPALAVPASEYKKKERIAKFTTLIMDALAQALSQAKEMESTKRKN
jgi:1-acyl-sn-glycerol-3-phosphate acyltransferase